MHRLVQSRDFVNRHRLIPQTVKRRSPEVTEALPLGLSGLLVLVLWHTLFAENIAKIWLNKMKLEHV
jgi:hypothetical protein